MCALMRPFKCRYKLNVYHVMESWRKLRIQKNTLYGLSFLISSTKSKFSLGKTFCVSLDTHAKNINHTSIALGGGGGGWEGGYAR